MEKGSLRCDANLSVRRRGAEKFGVKAEVKNLNSFRYLVRALEYEIERQVALVESGGSVEQETRLFNVAAGRTEPMRSKEFAHDYRYFPEPDLLPPMIDAAWREKIRREMPELPAAKRARFVRDYGLTDYDAGVLTATRALADYFEGTAKASPSPKAAANWIQSELLALLKDSGKEIGASPVAPSAVGELLGFWWKAARFPARWPRPCLRRCLPPASLPRNHRRRKDGASYRRGRDRETLPASD
jgi:aspartyl-tRNA(Asn)/glutamyl-tRNA(Gln) amidotransferase subunit B